MLPFLYPPSLHVCSSHYFAQCISQEASKRTGLRVLNVFLCYVLIDLLKQSVENSVCILHNLTFQLEAEAPTLFSRITALAKNVNRSNSQGEAGAISCFASPDKSAEHEVRRGRCSP